MSIFKRILTHPRIMRTKLELAEQSVGGLNFELGGLNFEVGGLNFEMSILKTDIVTG